MADPMIEAAIPASVVPLVRSQTDVKDANTAGGLGKLLLAGSFLAGFPQYAAVFGGVTAIRSGPWSMDLS